MVFSCNPSIPSCIIEIVLRVGSSQEISTSTHCPLDCLLRGLLYTSRYVQKPVTLSRHPVRKRQGPSLKTPSLNPTDTTAASDASLVYPPRPRHPHSPKNCYSKLSRASFHFWGISLQILLTMFLRHIYHIYRLNVGSNLCSYSTIPLGNLV